MESVLIVVIIAAIVIPIMVSVMGGDEKSKSENVQQLQEDLNNDNTPVEAPKEVRKEEAVVVDIKNFDGKPINDLIGIYGEPTDQYEATPPVVSTVEWETEQYNIYSEYNKGEEVVYSAIITSKIYNCGINGVTTTDIQRMLDFITLDLPVSEFSKQGSGSDTWYQARSVQGYESITIRCSNDGIYINPLSNNYWDWVDRSN